MKNCPFACCGCQAPSLTLVTQSVKPGDTKVINLAGSKYPVLSGKAILDVFMGVVLVKFLARKG